MKTIKKYKYIISSTLALALASSTLVAEESGAFVGVGVGYGASQVKFGSEKTDLNGISYEVIAGYKQFFTPSFGLRYYINFAYADASGKVKGTSEKIKGNVMDYGVNVDALYNLVASANANFGVFVGVGAGANTWGGRDIEHFNSKTGLNVALNAGLRSQFGKHHSIEIAARVPFIATTLEKADAAAGTPKVTASHTYNVGARYVFSF